MEAAAQRCSQKQNVKRSMNIFDLPVKLLIKFLMLTLLQSLGLMFMH